jgi:hypothetical protein
LNKTARSFFVMSQRKITWRQWGFVLGVLLALGAARVGWRAYRAMSAGRDFYQQVRYLVEQGGSVGEVPAREAFAVDFFDAIFADNPELLAQLKALLRKNLRDEPALYVGEVTGLLITYQTETDGAITDVVIHAIGGFPLARRKPSFHPGGYFFQQLDRELWNYGNMLLGLLGRDIVIMTGDETSRAKHQELLDSLMSGEIMPLVQRLDRPLHYTMVFPSPRHVVPPQIRTHIKAIIVKGYLSPYKGETDVIALSPNPRSANYAAMIIGDMKRITSLLLKTRWHGVERQTLWGPVRNPWWAYEMVQTLEKSSLDAEKNIVRLRSSYERVMVNALLKTLERMSRDLAAMQYIQAQGLDPRDADAKLATRKPVHYWSDAHQWGPDWPIPPLATQTNAIAPAAESALPEAPAVAGETGTQG